jgi:hypothetical protein
MSCNTDDPQFNYRIPPIQAQHELQNLLDYDELIQQRCNGGAFSNFQEGKITFLPTFKYDKRSDNFDSSPKRRIPAWTDRILYFEEEKQNDLILNLSSFSSLSQNNSISHSSSPLIHLRTYESVDVRHGDHRPVIAKFLITI